METAIDKDANRNAQMRHAVNLWRADIALQRTHNLISSNLFRLCQEKK